MKLFRYIDFVFESSYVKETVPVVISNELSYVLRNINSPISKKMQAMVGTQQIASLWTFSDSEDSIVITMAEKVKEIVSSIGEYKGDDIFKLMRSKDFQKYYHNRFCVSIRVGRLIKKLFGDEFSDEQIEDFVNEYKSQLDDKALKFKYLEGKDIIKGYESKRYIDGGGHSNALISSCMNDEKSVKFYEKCPVKLLLLCDNNNVIHGRSLIWETDKGPMMDKIYVAFNSDYYKFINFAISNNFYYKSDNKSSPSTTVMRGTNEFDMTINIRLPFIINTDDLFPYLDTFCFARGNILSNRNQKGCIILRSMEGGYAVNE